jgi:hypothetical protein
VTDPIANASPLRGKAWRRLSLVKLVWLYVAPTLDPVEPRRVKIRAVARALDIDPRSMRVAVRILTRRRYLVCAMPATRGTAGSYTLGERALRRVTGGVEAPVEPVDLLSDVARVA